MSRIKKACLQFETEDGDVFTLRYEAVEKSSFHLERNAILEKTQAAEGWTQTTPTGCETVFVGFTGRLVK